MDKISHILHNTSRVSSVDARDAQPMRPGAPAFGFPEVSSPVRDRVTRSSVPVSAQIHRNSLSSWKTKEQREAAIAAKMSREFFGKNDISEDPAQTAHDEREVENNEIANHAQTYVKRDLRPGSPWSFTAADAPQSTAPNEAGSFDNPKGNRLSIRA